MHVIDEACGRRRVGRRCDARRMAQTIANRNVECEWKSRSAAAAAAALLAHCLSGILTVTKFCCQVEI